ncbi:MAG: hypothetical protein JWQ49_3647, partial [Edaphobacter sp.]|nr:hypothetical protein [Edaphobacter sp.]
ESPDLSTTDEFFCSDSRGSLADRAYDRRFRSGSRSRHDGTGCAASIDLHTAPPQPRRGPSGYRIYFNTPLTASTAAMFRPHPDASFTLRQMLGCPWAFDIVESKRKRFHSSKNATVQWDVENTSRCCCYTHTRGGGYGGTAIPKRTQS